MKVKLYNAEKCDLCHLVRNGIAFVQSIYDFEVEVVDSEQAPKVEFYSGDTLVSYLSGLPLNSGL